MPKNNSKKDAFFEQTTAVVTDMNNLGYNKEARALLAIATDLCLDDFAEAAPRRRSSTRKKHSVTPKARLKKLKQYRKNKVANSRRQKTMRAIMHKKAVGGFLDNFM